MSDAIVKALAAVVVLLLAAIAVALLAFVLAAAVDATLVLLRWGR